MAKVKGTNFIGLVKVLRTHRARALDVLPPALHHYLEQRVLPSSWYPAVDFLGLQTAMASVIPLGATPYFQMGRLSAQLDLGGIYKNHLTPGEPLRTLASAQALWRNYHDTGELRPEPEGPRSALVEWRNYPECTKQLCSGTRGYVSEMVVLSGGKNVRLVELSCQADKAPACRWRITWD